MTPLEEWILAKTVPDGITTWPQLICQGIRDDDVRRRISLLEHPAGDQRDAEHTEVVWIDPQPRHEDVRFHRRSRVYFDVIVRRRTVAGRWRRRSFERPQDAGTCAQALQNGLRHRRALGAGAETLRWNRERNRDHAGAIEAFVEPHQSKIAANVEHAADEEHDGECDLHDRQRASPEGT